jgi:pilus assembly protein CpaB
VLSAGQDFKKDAEGKPITVQVINLLVTPEQAEQLSLASSQTQIQLVLRNPLDRDEAKTPGTALAHLFTGQRTGLAQMIASGEPQPAPRSRAPQPRPVQHAVQAPPPPAKKEAPFVMEIVSGTRKSEQKFENKDGGEGK